MQNPVVLIASFVGVCVGIYLFLLRRQRRQARDTHTLKTSIEKELHLPPSLHPVIDPNTCIGSLSCIKVCPEGDILGIVDGRAALVVAANCIGHSRCELECPVDAIKLVFGTSERGLDLPEVDEFFETNRAGVHIVGELGGMGLIKNAVRQGLQLGRHFKTTTKPVEGRQVHAAIVGAGPAGIATALAMKEAGLTFALVDQGASLGGTIANYPRQKLVMTETVDLPFYGKFGKPLISKESLMEMFKEALQKAAIRIYHGVKVTGIDGEDGSFELLTEKGKIRCQKVVLAIGRMGTPRKLDVPGEDLPKVTYLLLHPEQYAGKKVLVVGGGDSALEIAQMVSAEPGAEVSISYRSPAFGRAKQRNKDNVEKLIREGKINAIMSSNVVSIHPDKVVLDVAGTKTEIANDYVVVNVGGVLPTEFLKSLGVSIQRHVGKAFEKPKKKSVSTTSRVLTDERAEERHRVRLGTVLTAVGILILAGLWYTGRNYYWLPAAERVHSPLHKSLKPGGMWGHGVGVAATIVMLSNFLLPLRKHWRRLKGRKSIREWLTFHVFVGVMSPLVILFHSAFGSNNMVATLCYSSLICVVGTGLVGRFFFGLIPIAGDHYLEMTELSSRMEQLRGSLNPLLEQVRRPQDIHWLLRTATAPPPEGVGFFRAVFAFPVDEIRYRLSLVKSRSLFKTRDDYHEFATMITRLVKLKRQASVFRTAKKFMNYWRGFHVVLAVFLVLVIIVHIATAWYLGYRWIFQHQP
jgi:thioredoxin reductase/NAD-dependent dihydropyrimidine dehydrogenase PreA subunit